jgi:hypothetical protein
MATYEELATEFGSNTLISKIKIAVMVSADEIINELPTTTGHAERVAWAREALIDPEQMARRFWAAVLAANNSATIAAIQSATDTTIQNNVDAAVNVFAGVTA